MTTKVKCLKVDGDVLFKQFEGKIGILSGTKGVSGTTERVDFTEGGAMFLRPDQYEVVSA